LEPEPEIWVAFQQTQLWGKRVVQIMQCFFCFNGPNRSEAGAGADMLDMLFFNSAVRSAEV